MVSIQQDFMAVVENATADIESALQQLSRNDLKNLIREELLAHLRMVGLTGRLIDTAEPTDPKELIRINHAAHRDEYRAREKSFIERYGRELLRRHFANGEDIVPDEVEPILCHVIPDSEESALFRLATHLWSVPVSRGYGRRMRFLVRDRSNGKLIGLFALTDPVFNLKARDVWIGWNADDRRQRLVSVMDAHVVGAVPPYSQLLGGKVVASLMTSQEVCDAFTAKYGDRVGIISQQHKHAQLVLITVTSALGRSSLYNRLNLRGTVEFRRIGMTEGWGHFHVPDQIFRYMRLLLEMEGHRYASGYKFGQGPNWRMRVVREALPRVGLDANLLKHGISREIYAIPLAEGWREFLQGRAETCTIHRPLAEELGHLAVARWLVPRAIRQPQYQEWTREHTWRALTGVEAT